MGIPTMARSRGEAAAVSRPTLRAPAAMLPLEDLRAGPHEFRRD
jgi:hypothetical protein